MGLKAAANIVLRITGVPLYVKWTEEHERLKCAKCGHAPNAGTDVAKFCERCGNAISITIEKEKVTEYLPSIVYESFEKLSEHAKDATKMLNRKECKLLGQNGENDDELSFILASCDYEGSEVINLTKMKKQVSKILETHMPTIVSIREKLSYKKPLKTEVRLELCYE